ncbi:biotin-dependent carboxyltransferase family protein [Rugosimonospora acidiphila]|uniref:Biotin-dependent carboxyltransferase family protein n=1 Tax=Rugosimonospora acidiphila TaxID=556531 RepID=A0ABP9RG07_9ACTN
MIEVLRAGPLTTVQDLGRPGLAHLGVPRSGALDQPALRLANRLVGNPPDAAGLEVTLTGCRLRATVATWVAATGGYATVTVDGRPGRFGGVQPVPAGATLHIGRCTRGLRTYLALAGGVDVPPVLGSRSTDVLSGLGPAALRDGDLLPLGAPSGPPPPSTVDSEDPSTVDVTSTEEVPAPVEVASTVEVRVAPGPRAGWFADPGLAGATYTVSPKSNRVGVRLTGPALTRVRDGELPSEGVVLGAVQIPADGQPVIFLADHPTTGGYPVVAVVHPADLPLLAQARPGTTVVFRGSER